MKINISYPSTGCQKVIEVDDDRKLRAFYDKRISQEVEGDVLGDDFKGYIFRISGGNDKEGFAMKQGILTSQRVRILFSDGHSCFRIRRNGERKRKSIRGCIVSSALAVLNLVIVKKGENDIPGLTDQTKPRRLGPKRASRIRKLFNLTKEDDVRQYVIRRKIEKAGKKPTSKAPKIQRLVTPQRLQHKRQLIVEKRKRYQKSQKEAQEYNELVAKLLKEKRDQKIARKRSSSRRESSKNVAEKKPKTDDKAKSEEKKAEKKPADAKKADKKQAAPADAKKGDKKAAPADAKKGDKKAAPADAKKGDKKAAPADAKKGDKKAAAPAEKKGDKKQAAAPAEKKGDKKQAAAAAPAEKKGDKKQAAPAAPAEKKGDKKQTAPAAKKQEQPKKQEKTKKAPQ